jgi:hypothetical protein
MVSPRCGVGNCEFRDPNNQDSKCSIYLDRKDCALSMRKRRKNANKSRQLDTVNWYGI